ncbi:MAG: ABC transporter permease [Actinobacteria bacterium]|nr:ABC transporter permease [Actinomycetota bacterium]
MQSSSSPAAATALSEPLRRPRVVGWGRLPAWLRFTLLLAALVGLWQAYVSLKDVNPLLFASPRAVAEAFVDGWRDGTIPRATWTTVKVLALGIGIGALVAAVLTVFATLTKIGDDLLVLLTSILNPLPGVAVLPLALLWFGLNTNALLFVIANATIWPIAINVTTGFRTVNPTIVAVGRNIGLSSRRLVTDVLAPAALPHTISGLKAAWAFGWRTIIAAELVFGVSGADGGLGFYINNAKLYLRIPQVFAGLVTIAILGVLFETVFGVLERRTVVRWGMKTVPATSGGGEG